jgi:uncharacterized protein (DUF1697 family)
MPRFVAFLRAINVGGRVVTMAELRGHFEALGFDDVDSFIASGNIVFSSRSTSVPALDKKIAKGLHAVLGYDVPCFVRTGEEVAAISKYKPFTATQMVDSLTFCVGLLGEPLAPTAKKALMALQTPIDIFHVNDREIYWSSKNGQSDSVISNVLLERTLKVRFTFRGMNTMLRLTAKYGF